MSTKLQQSVLLGTLGLAIAVAGMGLNHQGFSDLVNTVALWGLGSVLVVAGILWRGAPGLVAESHPPLSLAAVQQALTQTQVLIQQLETETAAATPELHQRLLELTTGLERQELQIAIAGNPGVGKTTLGQLLQTEWLPQLPQTCQLSEVSEFKAEACSEADLVLFLVQGDLSQGEYEGLQSLRAANQRLLLILNKQDQYLPDQRQTVVEKLRDRLEGMPPTDILAIAACPQPLKVRQHQADGSCKEWLEQPEPQLQALVERLHQVVTQEASQLRIQQTLRQTLALQAQTRLRLNHCRRQRALPIIERYQWIGAGTAFANPFPTLDMLAAAAITGQMVVDLGHLYQQPLTLNQGRAIAGTLTQLMLKLGLVEFSTQTLGALLKGHAVTYVAGGLIQGVSAAYLTRMAGLSLVEHFEASSGADGAPPEAEVLSRLLQGVFGQHQRLAFLKQLMQQVLERLRVQPSGVGNAAMAGGDALAASP